MPYLKGNLHVHTNFSDGVQTPSEMVAIYAGLGYDFIAITDHDYLIRSEYWNSIPEDDGRLIVFKGVELEYAPLRYQHIGKVLGEEEILYVFNHPQQYRLSIAEVNHQIDLIARDFPIHCMEVTSKGIYTKEYDTPEIPCPKIASDDAHYFDQCGLAWIEVESEKKKDAILRAVKYGNIKMGFKAALPSL